MFSSSTSLLVDRPSETLAGVNRFSKLLDSFRSRPTSPEQHPSISWNPYVYSDGAEEALESCGMEDSLHEADILLWKKRSRASLRRHFSVRHLAARELIDTEKSFVEGLEFLVTVS
uniref:DH domain-containing protein n=1 Tax=Caenorhabditis japonica TaxID=281687 RepID=A0A8R1IVX2_CAEJA